MATNDATFAGSIPSIYEQYLVPLLFEPYAEDMASRIRDVKQGKILETAAGTGAVTRAVAEQLPPAVAITATDLNQAMLDLAAKNLDGSKVTWLQADAQSLPFEDATFETVICQFGIMFVPDKPKAYREALRVLRPGGRFIFNVWDSLETNPVSKTISDVVRQQFPSDPPRFIERTPFGYHDPEAIENALQDAGFARITVETVEKTSRASSSLQPAKGLCQGSPLRAEIEARAPERLEEITRKAAEAIEAQFGTSLFENRMSALVVTAWRP